MLSSNGGPRKYLDKAFNFTGWTGYYFQEAIQRVATRIPPTATWSVDNKVRLSYALLTFNQLPASANINQLYNDEVYYLMGSVLDSIRIQEVDTLTDVDNKYDTYGRDLFAASGGQR
jgi:cellobiose dehydrogenase (acceptor)